MRTIILLSAVFAILFITCCASNDTANSDTVKQSEIYQSYSVTYDSGDNELIASASFRFGGSTGTTLNLVDSSKVIFEGEKMAMDNSIFSGTYYEISKQINFNGHYTFVFIDTDKKKYRNTVSMLPIELTEFPKQVNLNEGFTVKWEIPLADNEHVYCYIEDSKNNNVYVSTEIVGTSGIEITPDKIKTLAAGNANIYLVRESNSSLAEATHLGGKLYTKFISKKEGITIESNASVETKPQAENK